MTWFEKTFLIAVLACGLTACASTGNGRIKALNQTEAAQLIVVGKTDKAELEAALGTAEVSTFANGVEIWVYRYLPDTSGAFRSVPIFKSLVTDSGNFKELKIVFDKNGIVKKYQLIDTRENPAP